MEYIGLRFEIKEKIDHWAFKWSHWILEEVFVWPEFDVRQLLMLLNEDQLAEIIPKSKLKNLNSEGSWMNLCIDAPKLNEKLTSEKLGLKSSKGDRDFLMNWLNEVSTFF